MLILKTLVCHSKTVALKLTLHLSQLSKVLIKTYHKPFSSWSPAQDDAHEALGLEDFCMARFDEQNHIIVNSGD